MYDFFLNNFIYLFLAALGLCGCLGFSLVVPTGGCSSSPCSGFSLQWLLLFCLGHELQGRQAGFSGCSTWALEHRLSSCDTRASLLHGMWDLPGTGVEPVSPVLAGEVFTTESPGKPCMIYFNLLFYLENVSWTSVMM